MNGQTSFAIVFTGAPTFAGGVNSESVWADKLMQNGEIVAIAEESTAAWSHSVAMLILLLGERE